jgi:alkylation response protein AidB-like acyl-CoA dehydrogenase
MEAAAAPSPARRHDTETDWSGLAPSPETRDLADAAREHLTSLFPPARLRAILDGAAPADDLWPVVVEHGYSAVGLPESSGGIGTLLDLVAVLEEAGRALVAVPLLSTTTAAQTLLAAGLDVDELAERPRSLALRHGGELLVLDGAAVAEAVEVAEDEDADAGVVVRLLRIDAPAADPDPIDPSRPLVRIPADAAEVVAERRVAARPDDALAAARVAVAADLLGVAGRALDGAIAHALVREQFGRPIGSFQAVKHLLADAHVARERARSLTLGAAARLADDPAPGGPGTRLSLLAKAAASEAALQATRLQVQLLGAMGLTFEADAPLALRRAEQTARHLGTASELYAVAAADRMDEATREATR